MCCVLVPDATCFFSEKPDGKPRKAMHILLALNWDILLSILIKLFQKALYCISNSSSYLKYGSTSYSLLPVQSEVGYSQTRFDNNFVWISVKAGYFYTYIAIYTAVCYTNSIERWAVDLLIQTNILHIESY